MEIEAGVLWRNDSFVGDVSSRDGSKGIALSFPLCLFFLSRLSVI